MTETDWLNSTDPYTMLTYLQDGGKASDRRLRLWACSCVRRTWALLQDERSRRAVEVAEDYADGMADRDELDRTWQAATVNLRGEGLSDDGHANAMFWASDAAGFAAGPDTVRAMSAADSAIHAATWSTPGTASAAWDDEATAQAALLRDVFGNPFRSRPPVEAAWLAWNDGTVRKLAEAIYEEKAFERMPILADALEDAGCANVDILSHCRESGGVHVRGCFVLDTLLQKE